MEEIRRSERRTFERMCGWGGECINAWKSSYICSFIFLPSRFQTRHHAQNTLAQLEDPFLSEKKQNILIGPMRFNFLISLK